MKAINKFFDFVKGFFQSNSENSSKRLVGIAGAGFLYWTLYENSLSELSVAPADSLVYSVTALVMVSLGLTTIESVTDLIRGMKGGEKKPE